MAASRTLDGLLSQAIALCGAAEGENAEAATLFATIASRARAAPVNPAPPSPYRLPT